MRKLVFFIALLFIMPAAASAQDAQNDKQRINDIKRDVENYIAAEATLFTEDEAVELAKYYLNEYVKKWFAENDALDKFKDLDVDAYTHSITVMRGSMFRAFVYVSKAELSGEAPEAEPQPIELAVEPEAQPEVEPEAQLAVEPKAQPAVEPAHVEPVIAESELVEKVAVYDTVRVCVQDTVKVQVVDTLKVTVVDTILVKAPQEEIRPEVEPLAQETTFTTRTECYYALVADLCKQNSKDDVVSLLNSTKYSSSCTYDIITRKTKPETISESLVVIYDNKSAEVKALLSPRSSGRINLKTLKGDSTSNYPRCGALWITITIE